MPAMTMSKVLSEAQRLPLESQVLLVEKLLTGLQRKTASEVGRIISAETETPDVLSGLTDKELYALADAMMSADKQRRLTQLLRKNSAGTIKEKEIEELDALLVECQQISLLKAKALLTIQQRGSLIKDQTRVEG